MKDQKLLWVGLVFVALAVVGFVFVDFTPSGWAHEHKVHIFFPLWMASGRIMEGDGEWRGEEEEEDRLAKETSSNR
jgi:hypothetical protein